MIEALQKAGLDFEEKGEQKGEIGDDSMAGQVWCVTGSFERFKPRELAMEEIKMRNGKVVSQISGSTTHLLAGRGGGSKRKKAESLGVGIVTEEEFIGILGGLDD